jgi:hypothetical protein
MAANVPARVRDCVPILEMHMAVEGKGQTVKIENGTSNRGAVLLAELKALVDTFPHHKRADVIKILETAFSRLNADKQSRHSVDLQPGARTVLDSSSSKTLASPDFSDGFRNEDQE